MSRLLILTTLLLIWTLPKLTFAERPTQKPEEATHIVTGTVAKVHREHGDYDEYLVQIKIDDIKKGEGFEPRDTPFAYVFDRKAGAPAVPSASGHHGVPKEGERIQALVQLRRGVAEGLYPDWFEVLKPVPGE